MTLYANGPVITTAAELDALPGDSVVISREGGIIYEATSLSGYEASCRWFTPRIASPDCPDGVLEDGPVTVVWTP